MIILKSSASACSCLYQNGARKWDDKTCPVHHPPVYIPKTVESEPPVIVDKRKKKPVVFRIGMRYGICKCTMDGKGCITNLSFDCDVHAQK